MSLQAELDALMEGVRTQVPGTILSAVDQAYAELGAPGKFPHALKSGAAIPRFRLPDAAGQTVDMQDLLAQGPVVISFYRGAWCPFCNIELRALQKILPEIKQLGATLVAISPEKPDFSQPLIERDKLEFTVLSDVGNQVARQFGIVFALEGELKRISHEVFGVDLPQFNGDQTWEIPIPATYVVAPDGTIKNAFVDPEFRNRIEPAKILEVLASLATVTG